MYIFYFERNIFDKGIKSSLERMTSTAWPKLDTPCIKVCVYMGGGGGNKSGTVMGRLFSNVP